MPRLHTIDLAYLGTPEAIAAYAIETDDGVALIECGPASTREALTAGLAAFGAAPADVRHLLVTHIHFDHAGAAGWLARESPEARVHVHAFGAKHLIDPSKLINSATRIYGDDMDRLWGPILPIPAERVVAVEDGDALRFGGLTITAIETPGHARHHHAYATELDGERLCFTGDAAAAVVREAPTFISLPAPPPEFDPQQWAASIARLRDGGHDAIYPTHYGRIDDPAAHLDRVAASIDAHVAWITERRAAGDDAAAMAEDYAAWFMAQADAAEVPAAKRAFYAKGSLVNMNLAGVLRWRQKLDEAAAAKQD
ncbi:MAG: MBL fold metallo-hydrolase [Phycisphaerales bacterium]